MTKNPIRVLVADCSASVRRAVRIFLSDADDVIVAGEALCGKEAVEMVDRLHPHVALVDCTMPDFDCIEILKLLKALPTATGVVVLDTYGRRSLEALEAGASAYLLKDDLQEHLLDAIRCAAKQPDGTGAARRERAKVLGAALKHT
jgi:two-component system NarL family response regulator